MGIAKNPIEIYLDSASTNEIFDYYSNPEWAIDGFTTNPTLMRAAGVNSYLDFVYDVTSRISDLPISFEVLVDDLSAMRDQAIRLNKVAQNVWVKIPVSNSKGESTAKLVGELNKEGIKVNVTAMFTMQQIEENFNQVIAGQEVIFSVFAGRISDAGYNSQELISDFTKVTQASKNIKVLWASTREAYNLVQAVQSKCQIITLTAPILQKTSLFGKNLKDYSLETVQMFLNDANASGYKF
jgi:transaldolase